MALDRRPEVGLRLVTRRDDASRWRTMTGASVLAWVPPARPVRLAYERFVLGRRVQRKTPADGSGQGTDSGLGPETGTVYHGPHYTLPAGLECGRVVTVHDLTFFDHPEWHERSKVRLFQSAIRRAARLADVIVCVSTTTAARLQALVDVRGEVVVAEHGVDRLRFSPGPVDATVLPAGLGSSGEELIVHVGTLEPRKGIVDLVAAFDEVAATRPSARLVLAGLPGWGAAAVDAAIARSGGWPTTPSSRSCVLPASSPIRAGKRASGCRPSRRCRLALPSSPPPARRWQSSVAAPLGWRRPAIRRRWRRRSMLRSAPLPTNGIAAAPKASGGPPRSRGSGRRNAISTPTVGPLAKVTVGPLATQGEGAAAGRVSRCSPM
jgi:hypothetical protein